MLLLLLLLLFVVVVVVPEPANGASSIKDLSVPVPGLGRLLS